MYRKGPEIGENPLKMEHGVEVSMSFHPPCQPYRGISYSARHGGDLLCSGLTSLPESTQASVDETVGRIRETVEGSENYRALAGGS